MAPLSVEVYNQDKNEWTKAGEVKPGERPGSISDNKQDGDRDIYMFACNHDDSKSTIYRSGVGFDIDLISSTRVVNPMGGLEVIKELQRGESFEMEVKTDNSPAPRHIRFTHK